MKEISFFASLNARDKWKYIYGRVVNRLNTQQTLTELLKDVREKGVENKKFLKEREFHLIDQLLNVKTSGISLDPNTIRMFTNIRNSRAERSRNWIGDDLEEILKRVTIALNHADVSSEIPKTDEEMYSIWRLISKPFSFNIHQIRETLRHRAFIGLMISQFESRNAERLSSLLSIYEWMREGLNIVVDSRLYQHENNEIRDGLQGFSDNIELVISNSTKTIRELKNIQNDFKQLNNFVRYKLNKHQSSKQQQQNINFTVNQVDAALLANDLKKKLEEILIQHSIDQSTRKIIEKVNEKISQFTILVEKSETRARHLEQELFVEKHKRYQKCPHCDNNKASVDRLEKKVAEMNEEYDSFKKQTLSEKSQSRKIVNEMHSQIDDFLMKPSKTLHLQLILMLKQLSNICKNPNDDDVDDNVSTKATAEYLKMLKSKPGGGGHEEERKISIKKEKRKSVQFPKVRRLSTKPQTLVNPTERNSTIDQDRNVFFEEFITFAKNQLKSLTELNRSIIFLKESYNHVEGIGSILDRNNDKIENMKNQITVSQNRLSTFYDFPNPQNLFQSFGRNRKPTVFLDDKKREKKSKIKKIEDQTAERRIQVHHLNDVMDSINEFKNQIVPILGIEKLRNINEENQIVNESYMKTIVSEMKSIFQTIILSLKSRSTKRKTTKSRNRSKRSKKSKSFKRSGMVSKKKLRPKIRISQAIQTDGFTIDTAFNEIKRKTIGDHINQATFFNNNNSSISTLNNSHHSDWRNLTSRESKRWFNNLQTKKIENLLVNEKGEKIKLDNFTFKNQENHNNNISSSNTVLLIHNETDYNTSQSNRNCCVGRRSKLRNTHISQELPPIRITRSQHIDMIVDNYHQPMYNVQLSYIKKE